MNSTNYDQLRWCERYKNTLVFQHVEAFAKKVRSKKIYEQDKDINAIAEQNEIDVFFKENWEYQHVHSNLSCDISNPIYIQERVNLFEDEKMIQEDNEQGSQLKYRNIPLSMIDNEKNKQQIDDQSVKNYYKKCYYFIQRLKSEHENETAFKIQGRWIEYSVPYEKLVLKQKKYTPSQKKFYQNLICARKVYKNFFETIGLAVQQMSQNARFNLDKQQFNPYKIQQIYQNLSRMIDQNQNKDVNLKLDNQYGNLQMHKWIKLMMENKRPILKIHQFMANFVGVLQEMNKQKRSCLFNFQPEMEHNITLTYLIHPILLSLYAAHHKERISWQNQYEHDVFNIDFNEPIKEKKSEMEQNEHTTFDEDTPHFQISRTVFINLDGYQSQFNIQFVKNMRHHLMYISFPIFDKSGSEENITFNNRFFKKLYFNYTRDLYEYNSEEFDTIINQDFLDQSQYDYDPSENLQKKFDPQFYFKSIANMYKDKTTPENNSNINIFPIIFKYLQEQLSTLFFDKNSNASTCPSYFIYYIFQNFMLDDIRKFNPGQIVISFSGKINIIDQHFIKLVQQLAVISKRRVMFYPNFTTKLVNQVTFQAYQSYDNFLPQQESSLDSYCNIDLMRKMSQFLKICSGTYNLQISEERETIIPKYKLAKLNKYIRGLLNALSNEQFPHLKNKISQLTLRTESFVIDYIIQQSIDQIKKSIPPFYQLLFDHIISIIKHPQNNKFPPILHDTVQQLRKQYKFLVNFQKQQMSKLFIEDIYRKLQLEFISQRYSQFAYVYFKTRPDKRQFQDIREQLGKDIKSEDNSIRNRKQLNNLGGLYALHLRYSKQKGQKISIPIYPHTQLLYRQNQIYKERRTEKRKYANLMLMNHLQQNQFVSFAGLVPINFSHESDQKKIKTERGIQMHPIRFNGMPQLAFGDFVMRSGWNYAETSRYFFLFWPLEFNLIEAKLHYLRDQIYEPNILNQFYICQIPEKQHRLTFNRVIMNEPVAPRRSCSCLQLMDENKIIILGGFYSKEDNYLSLQTQITGIDLQDYSNNQKCKVTNQKGAMYSFIPQQKLKKKKKKQQMTSEKDNLIMRGNSYVPARRQYQFFQLQQLCDLTEQEIHNEMNLKTYVMMGGLGESFNRPYSLINYFYYIISVNMQTKTIQSIQRKIIHEKIMHSNIKGYIKNNKYFEKLPLYQQQKGVLKPESTIGTEQYVAHRSVYSFSRKLESGKQSYGQLEGKTKYLFAINIYNKFKKQYKNVAIKIGEYTDEKTNETYDLKLSQFPQGNNYLTISKRNSQLVTQIYLQKKETKSIFQKVALTHGSIISIDIRFKYIYAIIKHESYTSGRYVLTQCEIINENSEIILKVIHEFKQDNLQQYYLFVPRPNEVLLLHGLTFKDIKMEDMCISSISKKEQIVKKIPFPHSMNSIEGQKIKKCVTFMIKGQSQQTKALQIQSINLLLPAQSKPSFYIIRKYRLKFNSTINEFGWEQTGEIPVIFVEEYTKNALYVFRVEEGRKIELAQNYEIQPPLFSWTAKDMTERNRLNIIIRAKFTYSKSAKSKSMIGIGKISLNAGDFDKSKPIQISVGNMENRESRRVWELGSPLISHTKSMSKYEDMQDYNTRTIGMSE